MRWLLRFMVAVLTMFGAALLPAATIEGIVKDASGPQVAKREASRLTRCD